MQMDLYEAIAEVQRAATQYANVLEEDHDANSHDIDKLDAALVVSNDFLKLLRGNP